MSSQNETLLDIIQASLQIQARQQAVLDGANSALASAAAERQRLLSALRLDLWLDQVNGDDNADGTEAAPLRSIGECINRMAVGGLVVINLLGAYEVRENNTLRQGHVLVQTPSGSPRVDFSFAPEIASDNLFTPRFVSPQGMNAFTFSNVRLRMTARSPHVTARALFNNSGFLVLSTSSSIIDVDQDCDRFLTVGNGGIGISAIGTSIADGMAGKWIQGVSAGTAPDAVRTLAYTNLASL